jgi:hypothetical protein
LIVPPEFTCNFVNGVSPVNTASLTFDITANVFVDIIINVHEKILFFFS